jgi:rare lipoprotein A
MLALALPAINGCSRSKDGQRGEDLGQMTVSWYGEEWHGDQTASGERFDMNSMTAAHRTLPFGTRLLLINPDNDRRAIVVVNNRGPHIKGRDLDVSAAAARKLGIVRSGIAVLKVRDLGPEGQPADPAR